MNYNKINFMLCKCSNCLCPNKLCGRQKLRTVSLEDVSIENDNCCFCYYDALVKQLPEPTMAFTVANEKDSEGVANVRENEIIRLSRDKKSHIKITHANFSSDVSKPAYYVAVDYLKKKVVISIRGTQSLTDFITDMQMRAVPLPGVDQSLYWYGHEVIIFI
jgi:hypothetical protein